MNCKLNQKQKILNDKKISFAKKDIMIESKNIQYFSSLGSVGLSLRKPNQGDEYNMVKQYVQFQLSCSHLEESKIVFLEPQIDSGFPDIVIVYFDLNIAKKWCIKRKKLNKLDWRILHWIVFKKNIGADQLKTIFPNDFVSLYNVWQKQNLLIIEKINAKQNP